MKAWSILVDLYQQQEKEKKKIKNNISLFLLKERRNAVLKTKQLKIN